LAFLDVSTQTIAIQEPALVWRFANESSIGIRGASGWNPNQGEDQPFASASPADRPDQNGSYQVLIVEDNEADVFLITEAMGATNLPMVIQVVRDGEEAIRVFETADANVEMPCPALVILDINLPKKRGTEVLRHLRASRRCAGAVVIAISTSDSARDKSEMAGLGADGYFRKPSNYTEFMKLSAMVSQALLKLS
jgi:chemotaxis family two-component system response regulator Rcp1